MTRITSPRVLMPHWCHRLPGTSSDQARKRILADWVVKTKKQVVKLYAITRWSREADVVQKAMVRRAQCLITTLGIKFYWTLEHYGFLNGSKPAIPRQRSRTKLREGEP